MSLITKSNVSGQPGGKGGAFGVGGNGGKGGVGGASYEYSVTTDGVTRYYENPGGANGVRGRDGNDGESGQDGINGRAGNVYYYVIPSTGGNVVRCESIFNLKLVQFSYDDGIIEPGQLITVYNITISNRGGMKAIGSRTEICVPSSRYFSVSNKLLFKSTILPNHQVTLPKEDLLKFVVNRQPTPAIGSIVRIDTNLKICAEFCRTKVVTDIHSTPWNIQIAYPLELSVVRGGLCILSGDHVPITFKVKNHSSKDIGRTSAGGRLACFQINIVNVPSSRHSNLHWPCKEMCTDLVSIPY